MSREVVRSTGETRARGRRRPWPDDVRERALEVLRVDGLAAAHRATGVPKSTLTGWARGAGVDVTAVTASQRRAGQARGAQLTAATVDRLDYTIDLASTGLIRRLEANADAGELTDDDLGEWSAELGRFLPANEHAATVMRRYAQLTVGESTRDLSAALSRLIHDLDLLRGEATQRGALIVNFGIPRPVRPVDVPVVDVVDAELVG
jgi:hypothetical protein